jgi:hypothetical protein
VLGDEDGVVGHRRLPAVVGRVGGREPLVDEPRRVIHHLGEPLVAQVGPLAGTQREPPAERRAIEGGEQVIEVPHGATGGRVREGR